MHNKSTKSISNFKIREGMPIGVSVTLRGKRMYDFIDKLVSMTLPRVRDFAVFPEKVLISKAITLWVLKSTLLFQR